jgi:hypothetical protein
MVAAWALGATCLAYNDSRCTSQCRTKKSAVPLEKAGKSRDQVVNKVDHLMDHLEDRLTLEVRTRFASDADGPSGGTVIVLLYVLMTHLRIIMTSK